MKKLLSFIVVLLCLSFALTGCEEATTSKTCNHVYDDGVMTTNATCNAKGIKTYTCTNCGNTYTETVSLSSRLQEVYLSYCHSPWASHGSDWSYISIDTYPSSASSKYTYYTEADAGIQAVHSALGIPDYVYQDMRKTTALQGRQTASFTELTVTWTYHPDNGLEITYRINN